MRITAGPCARNRCAQQPAIMAGATSRVSSRAATPAMQTPRSGEVPSDQIATIERWIASGAVTSRKRSRQASTSRPKNAPSGRSSRSAAPSRRCLRLGNTVDHESPLAELPQADVVRTPIDSFGAFGQERGRIRRGVPGAVALVVLHIFQEATGLPPGVSRSYLHTQAPRITCLSPCRPAGRLRRPAGRHGRWGRGRIRFRNQRETPGGKPLASYDETGVAQHSDLAASRRQARLSIPLAGRHDMGKRAGEAFLRFSDSASEFA